MGESIVLDNDNILVQTYVPDYSQSINGINSNYTFAYKKSGNLGKFTAYSSCIIDNETYKGGSISYKSSNSKIISVDKSGYVYTKGIGTAYVTVTAAAITQDGIVIAPAATKKVKVTSKLQGVSFTINNYTKKKLQVKITKKNTNADGYEIQIAKNSKFTSGKKTYKIKSSSSSKTISSLKKGTKYYSRVRAYKVIDKKTYYSSWTTVKGRITVR